MSTEAVPETRRPTRRLSFLPIVLGILLIVASGAYLMERSAHATEKATLEGQLLQLRTDAEALKTKLRSGEHDVGTKPKAETKPKS
jgi:hypothetical protein